MQLIGLREQLNILQGIETAKALDGARPPLQLPRVVRLLNQSLHLNPGIAADLLEKVQQESLLGFTELGVMESEEHGLNPGITSGLDFNAELHSPKSAEKLTYMLEGFDESVVHDDVHPLS